MTRTIVMVIIDYKSHGSAVAHLARLAIEIDLMLVRTKRGMQAEDECVTNGYKPSKGQDFRS